MKTCFRCGVAKDRRQFYRHERMADGLLGKCKECTKRDVREHRQKNRAKVNAYDRMRNEDPERAAKMIARTRAYSKAHPERTRANLRAKRAIAAGKLVRQPCEVCGEAKVVAHHDDYSKPLDVRWLCHSCHRRHHSGTLQPPLAPAPVPLT